jgi:hypothetical protein
MIHGVQRRPSHAPTSSETPAPASFDAISSRLGGTPARSSALRTAAAHSALLDTIRMLVRCAFATSSLAARATRPCSSDARTHASVTRKSSAGHPSVPRSERSSPLRTHMSHGSGRSPSSGATADAVAGDDCREGAEAQPTARSASPAHAKRAGGYRRRQTAFAVGFPRFRLLKSPHRSTRSCTCPQHRRGVAPARGIPPCKDRREASRTRARPRSAQPPRGSRGRLRRDRSNR